MGFDVSYHPVDLAFIHGRLLPALLYGEGFEDLEAAALQHAKVRYLANAWGLGLNAACRARSEAETHRSRAPGPSPAAKPGFLTRLFARTQAEPSPAVADEMPAWVARHDADIHIWGRPYFITVDEPAEISRAIDEWLATSPSGVDALATRMVAHLAPELVTLVRPDLGGGLPSDDAFRETVGHPLGTCRDVLRALDAGEMFRSEDGEEVDPASLVGREFAFLLVRIASWFRPGWMDRGQWPSAALPAVAPNAAYWQPATALLAPIIERHPRVQPQLAATIEANYEVGGFVAAQDVRRLRADIELGRADLLAAGYPETSWQKLHEAVLDAEGRGMAFLEATEIYSGPEGVLN